MIIWLVHFQFYFTGTQAVNVQFHNRNIPALLWTLGVAGFDAYHFVYVAYETEIHIYFTDFIDTLYICDRTLKTALTEIE